MSEAVTTTQTQPSDRKGLFILAVILIIAAVTQAQNMFEFPYYQDIEGTNISNAWSLINTDALSPYTYAYDEPPAGSFLLSGWAIVAGGISAFGSSIYTGRALMLLMHILATVMVYAITRKLSNSDLTAAIATLIFVFSPLVTILQRRVLLDNIMIVWLLTSFYLVIGDRRTLVHYLASAGFFGLAVLTKGAAIFTLPAFIYILRSSADKHHRSFATNLWAALSVFLIAFYPLYAQMKQELFPEGWFLGGDFPHVSLLEAVMDRGPDTGRFLNIGSGLGHSFESWVNLENFTADPILIYAGLVSLLFVTLLSFDNKRLRPIVAMNLGYMFYLLLGGQVFDSDIIPMLPLLAINTGIIMGAILKLIAGSGESAGFIRYSFAALSLGVLLYPFWMFYSARVDIYSMNQVSGQMEALAWVQNNVSSDATIVIDNYAFVELRETHPNAHHYWRVDTDPAIKFNVLDDNQCNIDYLITTPQVMADIDIYNMDLMDRTLRNSQVIRSYENNGWPVEIRQVSKTDCFAEVANSND